MTLDLNWFKSPLLQVKTEKKWVIEGLSAQTIHFFIFSNALAGIFAAGDRLCGLKKHSPPLFSSLTYISSEPSPPLQFPLLPLSHCNMFISFCLSSSGFLCSSSFLERLGRGGTLFSEELNLKKKEGVSSSGFLVSMVISLSLCP